VAYLSKTLCAILYFILVTLGVFYLFQDWAYDDPFITYRYAQNVASGLGFVYNPGERVLSTTTPLFTLLLAALSLLWNNLPRLANLIGAMSIALGGVLLYWLANTLSETMAVKNTVVFPATGFAHQPWVGWAGLALYPTSPLLLSCLGSETPLYIAFCLACFVFYARANYSLTALFAALAVLTRADGLLLPLLLAADHIFVRRRSIPWRSLLLFLGLILPWFVFAWIYFGSPVPATLAAKQHQGLMAISQRFAPGFITIIKSFFWSWSYAIQASIAILGIIYLGAKLVSARCSVPPRSPISPRCSVSPRYSVSPRCPVSPFIAWPVVYFMAFSALGVTRYFWYYAPLVPGFVTLVGLGVACLAGLMQSTLKLVSPLIRHLLGSLASRITFVRQLPQFAILALLLLLAGFQFSHLTTIIGSKAVFSGKEYRFTAEYRARNDPRYTIYKKAGDWLNAHTAPTASVGALEVGIIGYYAQRPMIDFAGLIQPEVSALFKPQTTYADAAAFAINRYQPDYLVLREGDFPQLENSSVVQNCQLVQRFEGLRYHFARNLTVYDCRRN